MASITSTNNQAPVDLRERLEVLFWQEMTSYKTEDYLGAFQKGLKEGLPSPYNLPLGSASIGEPLGDENHIPSSGDHIKEHWREIICEWAYNLVDHFDLPRERVSVFTNLLDRYLQRYLAEHPEGINKRCFQLLSLTCLYITIKLECHQGYLSMDMMIHLSREKFTKEQMVDMEKDILKTLEWKLHPPTPSVFFQHFLILLQQPNHKVHQDTIETARFLMELAALDYQSVNHRPSRIALAALLNAMEDRNGPLNGSPRGAVEESHYNFLLSLIAPSERVTVDQCRIRLSELYHGVAADDDSMDVIRVPEAPLDVGRMTSPVSVVHNYALY